GSRQPRGKQFRRQVEVLRRHAEEGGDARRIVRRRPRLAGDIAVELLPVYADLPADLGDRTSRRAGEAQVLGKGRGISQGTPLSNVKRQRKPASVRVKSRNCLPQAKR